MKNFFSLFQILHLRPHHQEVDQNQKRPQPVTRRAVPPKGNLLPVSRQPKGVEVIVKDWCGELVSKESFCYDIYIKGFKQLFLSTIPKAEAKEINQQVWKSFYQKSFRIIPFIFYFCCCSFTQWNLFKADMVKSG